MSVGAIWKRGNRTRRKGSAREYESRLVEFRLAAKLTVADLCKKTNMHDSNYYTLATGVSSPFYKTGEIKPYVLKMLKVLKCQLGDIFPRYACVKSDSHGLISHQINDATLSDFSQNTPHTEREIDLNLILSQIAPRESEVIKSRFWEERTL